jgi:thiol peroxidase
MSSITFKGNPVHTSGSLPKIGSTAPDFLLTKQSLADASLADFSGKVKILNIVPSIDTGVCAASARAFNKAADEVGGVVILTISRDAPFAQIRFCEAEGIRSVITLSELRNRDFGRNYGLEMLDGPLAGLLSRVVIVLDAQNKVVYSQQVPEIAQEPDYRSALDAAKAAARGEVL